MISLFIVVPSEMTSGLPYNRPRRFQSAGRRRTLTILSRGNYFLRFRERLNDPLKQWKLSPEDLRNRGRWAEYEAAIDEMFRKTSTVPQPWTAVPGDDKRYGRLVAMKAVLERLADGVDTTPHSLDSEFEGKARKILGVDASG